MANTLLIAFDNNLFDTEGFYDLLPSEPEEFRGAYDQTVRGDYSPESYAAGEYSLDEVAKDLRAQGVNVTTEEIRHAFGQAPKLLRDPETLEYLKDEYDIDDVVVATRTAHPAWQRRKIHASGVEKYVDDVVIVYDPKIGDYDVDSDTEERSERPEDWKAQLVNGDADSIDLEAVNAFLSNNERTLQDVLEYLETGNH